MVKEESQDQGKAWEATSLPLGEEEKTQRCFGLPTTEIQALDSKATPEQP